MTYIWMLEGGHKGNSDRCVLIDFVAKMLHCDLILQHTDSTKQRLLLVSWDSVPALSSLSLGKTL